MKINHFIFILIVLLSCNQKNTQSEKTYIHFNSDSILYTGRINFTDTAAVIYWQGSSIKLNFKGSSFKILMQDEHNKNYYNIILDSDSIILFRPDSTKKWYTLISNIENKKHSLEIFKRTEWTNGATYIYGFKTANNSKLLAPPPKPNKTIEFFGNSITAGYAIEDSTGNRPDSIFTNNYLTYAAITARHYHANYYSTSRSGIGITISWFPMIMEDMYYRLNPADSTSLWDFSKVQVDLVLINLLQNDHTLTQMTDYPEFKHRFGNKKPTGKFIIEKYKNFVQKIREKYPNANIVCALGPMAAVKDEIWKGYIKEVVKEINDPKIYSLFFPYQNKTGHPKIKENKDMADILIKFIKQNKLL